MRRTSVRAAVGVAILAGIFWWVAPQIILTTLGRADSTFLLAVLAMVIQIVLAGIRWRLLIRATGSPLSFKAAMQTSFIASLTGQVMPGGVGVEVARLWMGRITGIVWSKLVSLAVVDRVLVLLALGVFAGGGMLSVSASADMLVVPILFGVCIVIAPAAVLLTEPGRRLIRRKTGFLHDAKSLIVGENARPVCLFLACAVACLAPLNLAFVAFLLAQSMSIDLSLVAAVTWIPIVLGAAAIPVSIGGWGIREAAAVAILGPVGVAAPEAMALSIGLGVSALVSALPGAFMLPTRSGQVATPTA